MRNSKFLTNASRTFHRVGFKIKKNSPTILVAAGIVGVVASTVMACKATTKIDTVLDETKDKVAKIHDCMADEGLKESGEYTEKDGQKDLTIVYANTGVKLAKLYAPSVAVGALSIASILASHRILTKRNVAISAAYAIVDKGFKDYRKRVKERFGDRVDYELKHNIKTETVETLEIDENGKEKTGVKNIDVIDHTQYSEYAVIFDETNELWQDDASYNKMFLLQQERYANDRLKAVGFVFLNEVYEMLGFPRTKAGQMVGWVYDPANGSGDNFIDFGIFDVHKAKARDFVNGYEKAIILDFNPDGNIWELMA